MQRREEEHLRSKYYVRKTEKSVVVDVQDVLVKTSLLEELPFINSHIIITGKYIYTILCVNMYVDLY